LGAVEILKTIPGVVDRKRAIHSWLNVARQVNPDETIHEYILKYINNSQDHFYGIQVTNILEITRADDMGYKNDLDWQTEKRMLLWHGTSEDKLASILRHGFQMPPYKSQMFGRGIYFADR